MQVVIVAKTRQGGSACVGGITFDGRSVRLIPADAAEDERANMAYRVGDVWEIEAEPAPTVTPPHVENIIVRAKRRRPPLTGLVSFIERLMPPMAGGWKGLFSGKVESSPSGAIYVAERSGVPTFSTMFWRPDQPLTRTHDGKRVRYRYPTPDGGRTLVFVGFQEPLELIPAGALLRVSLAHWWRPADKPDEELRCYAQLSGWILPDAPEMDLAWEDEWAGPDEGAPDEGAPAEVAGTTTGQSPLAVLQAVFGYDEFRPLQAEIIDRILRGQDTLVVMPTGGGKSLCYQLPAMLFDGLTVVVSPLISLMHDQVTQLQEWGIPGVYLNSTLDYKEYVATMRRLRRGEIKLLYIAPESLLRPETLVLLDECRVRCLAIDEAHCISEWGHDFRPEYRQLATVRERWPEAVCVALTATATPRVRSDIQAILRFSAAGTFLASFDRPNLLLEVVPKTEVIRQALEFVRAHSQQSGIIYAATIRQVEALTAALAREGISIQAYHGDLDGRTRHQRQTAFIHDDVQVMAATVAFGMGIDKPDVRFVLHVDLPRDLEHYYQQIGRAGRDGLRADCRLLFNYGDVTTLNYFIERGAESERKGREFRLEAVLRWAQSAVCRRRQLLTYFGEMDSAESCAMCDNCRQTQREQTDLTLPAQKFLTCVARTGEQFGTLHIIHVLRGSRNQRILARKHDQLSIYGTGREYSADQWRELARQFIQRGLLIQDTEHGQLKLTPAGRAVFKGEKVWGAAPTPTAAGEAAETPIFDADLFNQLRGLRKRLATQRDVPPYVIFADRALQEMATYFPHTRDALAQIYGVGARKVEQYAELFLPLIRDYCAARGLTERARPGRSARTAAPRPPSPAGLPRTAAIVQGFQAGQSLDELAQAQGVARQTVIDHLDRAWRAGQEVSPARLQAEVRVSAETQSRVLALFTEFGSDRLKPIFEALEAGVPYVELALLRLIFVMQSQV